jgi:hypothetical protein
VWAIAKRDDPTLLNAVTPMLGDKSEIVRYNASAAFVRLTALRARFVEQAGRAKAAALGPSGAFVSAVSAAGLDRTYGSCTQYPSILSNGFQRGRVEIRSS